MKISVIITVLNEAKNIKVLIDALRSQQLLPNEVIIVDGGSRDGTYEKLSTLAKKHTGLKLRVFQKMGNRSVGRNEAIHHARHEWIAITDAGCIPDQNWLAELVLSQLQTKAMIVGGYFYPLAKNNFEAAASCYALTMPRLIKDKFLLPTTRSMLISAGVLKQLGGFDERLSDNEDYALSRKMMKLGLQKKMTFAPRAWVGWVPVRTWAELIKMLFRFARGDAYANLWRPKVVLIFGRYLFALILFSYSFLNQQVLGLMVLLFGFVLYLIWATIKNYQYAKSGWFYLPIMQIVSDLTVMAGSIAGLFQTV